MPAGEGSHTNQNLLSVSPAGLTQLPVSQPSAMQIIACTRPLAFSGGQLCPELRGLRGRVGTPSQANSIHNIHSKWAFSGCCSACTQPHRFSSLNFRTSTPWLPQSSHWYPPLNNSAAQKGGSHRVPQTCMVLLAHLPAHWGLVTPRKT